MHKSSIQCVVVILLCTIATTFLGPSRAVADSFWSQLFDVSDGRFDVSNLVASERGFLPVPILITEPAIGYGGGMAAVFFHEDAEEAENRRAAMESGEDDISGLLPPSTSVVLGAATENGSWLAGGGHQGIWKDDRIRYLGAAGYASINLKFNGIGDGTPLDDSPEQYNIQGLFILQDIKFRLGNSGAGKAAEKIGELGGEDTRTTIGGGFRYLIARRLGLRAGIDVARGPEEWAIYLPFGNAWLM